jgi:hypothetical protein
MPQVHVSVVSGRNLAIVHGDFVSRGRLVYSPSPRRETEEDAFARALWLEKHGREDDAIEHLDRYIRRTCKS